MKLSVCYLSHRSFAPSGGFAERSSGQRRISGHGGIRGVSRNLDGTFEIADSGCCNVHYFFRPLEYLARAQIKRPTRTCLAGQKSITPMQCHWEEDATAALWLNLALVAHQEMLDFSPFSVLCQMYDRLPDEVTQMVSLKARRFFNLLMLRCKIQHPSDGDFRIRKSPGNYTYGWGRFLRRHRLPWAMLIGFATGFVMPFA